MIRVLYWKIRISIRSITRDASRTTLFVLSVLVSVAVASLAFFASRWVFQVVLGATASPEVAGAGPFLAANLLSLGFLLTLVMSLLTALGVAFSTMYSSSDLPLLFAAPLSVKEVFLVKFAEIILKACLPTLIFAVPMLSGYGAAILAGPVFYLQIALLAAICVLLSTALGVGLNLLAVRIIPPYRIKELGAALGTLFGAATYALLRLGPRHFSGMSMYQVLQGIEGFSLSAAGISPAWWLAQAARAASKGDFGDFLGWTGLAFLISGALMLFSFSLVTGAFYGGWIASGEVHRKDRRSRSQERLMRSSRATPGLSCEDREQGLAGEGHLRNLAERSPVVALALKELRYVSRDLREISSSVYVMVMMIVGLVGSARGGGQWLKGLGQAIPLYASLAMTFLMSWGLVSSLGLGAISREGSNWPLLRTTPVTGREIILGKALGILFLVLPVALVTGSALTLLVGGGSYELAATFFFVVLVVPAMVSIEVSAGSIQPKFDVDDPRQRASGLGFLLSVLMELPYAGLLALGVFLAKSGWLRFWSEPWAESRAISVALGVLGLAVALGASIAAITVVPGIAGRALDEREAVEETKVAGTANKGKDVGSSG